ncbi:unnamed protein product [Mytilus edulis]|uniref:Uncharacterized protein n=1 Tax=Mytilus edulis TaxID=6550 RepID=A0A8S3R774_MYTED|nr:unnamed protein product [Mytilus edulis]
MFGGSMSFEIEKSGNDFMAKIKVLTAWKIGTGPCGTDCNYTDIERSTATVRQDLINKYGSEYLGYGKGETGVYGISTSRKYVNKTDEVNSHIIEKVQLLNMGLHWEMDQADITATISQGTDYMDMNNRKNSNLETIANNGNLNNENMTYSSRRPTVVRKTVTFDCNLNNENMIYHIYPDEEIYAEAECPPPYSSRRPSLVSQTVTLDFY